MKKLLLTVAMMLASAPAFASSDLPLPPIACDLSLEKAGNQLHAHITCDGRLFQDGNLEITPKSKTCIMQVKGVEKIEHNLFAVETKCDISMMLIIKLDGDTLYIRSAENS
jgi:hypothetical protein